MCNIISTVKTLESEENFIESINQGWFGDISTFFDSIGVWFGVLGLIVSVMAVILWSISYVKKINALSIKKVERLVAERKYIRGLFVELNDSKEKLRYFVYGDKWKERIINEYNAIFSDYYGDLLKEVFGKTVNLTIPRKTNIEDLVEIIENTREFLNRLYKKEVQYPEKYKESMVIFHIYSNRYDERLLELKLKAEYIKAKYIILIGSAGNGKTNLLCSMVEFLNKSKYPCVFLNAKDIESDIEEYFIKQLNFPQVVSNKKWGMKILRAINKIRRKQTYVIIDAVNENNQEEFLKNISDFIESLLNENNIKLLISCRSEYYEAKYKKILAPSNMCDVLCDNIQTEEYSPIALNRLFDIYAKTFDYKGKIGKTVRHKLGKQLLLLRIFFEVYKGTDCCISDLDQNTLYNNYIKMLEAEKKLDISEYLFEVAGLMIDKNKYDYVLEKNVSKSCLDIQDEIDGTILLSKTMVHMENTLLEEREAAIYFVFDEMRDYCIAKCALKRLKANGDDIPDKNSIIRCINEFDEKDALCKEGVINYIYREYKNRNDNELCAEIIQRYIKPADIVSEGNNYVMGKDSRGWGMQLIFDYSGKRMQCEDEYLDFILQENPGNITSRLFAFLINEEKNGGMYSLELLYAHLDKIHNIKKFSKVLNNCVDAWEVESVRVTDFIAIDQELEKCSEDASRRFREFEILFGLFFDWQDKRILVDYLKEKCNIDDVQNRLKNRYYFTEE